MISPKYKEMFDVFINHYKDKHVNPWHEISEDELNDIYNNIVSNQDIIDDYSFNYLMNVIIKKLSGILDAHTQYNDVQRIPMNFKIFNDEVLVNYPDNLSEDKLIDWYIREYYDLRLKDLNPYKLTDILAEKFGKEMILLCHELPGLIINKEHFLSSKITSRLDRT